MRLPVLANGLIVLVAAAGGLGAAAEQATVIEAAKHGDLETVRVFARSLDVSRPAPDGTTALHWAAYRGDADIVDVLLRSGARVDAATRLGVTPLTLACRHGSAAVIEQLLKAGADPNTLMGEGETALMTAAQAGSAAGVKVLLAHGANVNARERTEGQTALMWAAARNRVGAIRALLEGGADPTVRSARRPRAAELVAAIDRGNRGNQYYVPFVDGFSALTFAAREGHIDAVRALLDGGAGPDAVLSNGMSALVVAIKNAHWELAGLLLDRGADPNAAAQGWAALHELAYTRRLNFGTLPHPVETGSMTPFDLARKLITTGARVDARMTREMIDGYRHQLKRPGATPLLLAAKGVDREMVKILLDAGADPHLPTNTGTTPLMVAAGVEMQNPGEDSYTNDDALETVKLLLAAGAEVNAVNDAGETALHGVARRGANVVTNLLVERGARLDVKNDRGLMPLHVADGLYPNGRTIFLAGASMPETAELMRRLMVERGLPVWERPQGIHRKDEPLTEPAGTPRPTVEERHDAQTPVPSISR